MWSRRIAVLVLLSIPFIAACGSTTEPLLTTWEGNLTPVPPATVGGSVAAVTQLGRTEASVQIRDAEPGAVFSWHIDSGTCRAPGQTQGGQATYPPLTSGENGTASTNAILAALFQTG